MQGNRSDGNVGKQRLHFLRRFEPMLRRQASARFFLHVGPVGDTQKRIMRFVHVGLEFLVALPVAVGLLDDDVALEEQPLEHLFDVELRVARVAHPERDVLEVAEQRHDFSVCFGCHFPSRFASRARAVR